MGQKHSARLNDASVPEDGFKRYLKGEFAAMDTAKHGTLSLHQFEKLLTFLGYDGEMKPETIFHKGNFDSKKGITVEEYCKLMNKFPDVKNRTNRLRALFLKFDHSNDGFAPKKDVVEEIRKMGVEIDKETLSKVDNMDINKDGKISYQEYVYTSLKEKKYI
ncbi:calmodulin-4-like isoform X2 [Mytilus californianus]|uniref:calmodulin-4-like isoform X2 n=1 Tax=Mytilus californianus TaxID=6549 RepID=UPI0022452107|nr:calmodulin-4-like isoform X2 [Mytilus californianus]